VKHQGRDAPAHPIEPPDPVAAPIVGASDYLALYARLQPTAPAVQDLTSGHTWTYQSFERTVAQFAALLREHGIAKGDRVAALAKNCAELVVLHLACARIGAIFVPLNWRLTAMELGKLIEDASPSMLLGDAMLVQARLDGMSLKEFGIAAQGVEPLAHAAIDQHTASLILYTSGTSGRPKGVLLSERNIWHTALNFSLLGRVTHESTVLCDSPMFHIIGLVTNIRPALMRGGRLLLSEGFAPARTLARLADPGLGITHYFCVPQMAAMLRADPAFDPARLRRLTAIFSGGAPHSADAIRAWTREGIPMVDGFGMSEAGTVSCMPLDIELIDSHAGSAGIIPPGLEVRIVNEHGDACASGEPGEILVRGPGVAGGYWQRPDDTLAAFRQDGWLRTGDVGRVDADGFLWLIDRKKDMFISGGENVYPAEIESALGAYPNIAECAVVGVADARWGEVGHLVIVPMPTKDIEVSKVTAYLETRLARYKVPKRISFADKLPRNGAGKIVKSTLRATLMQTGKSDVDQGT
jgi:fatty-acyl-CoA synthase